MPKQRLPWQDELAIIDRTMKAISGVTDPEELVEVYWTGIGELIAVDDYLALSRRNVEPPFYLITRSSRFTEHFNPWTQRERLPKMSGGLLGEIIYANRPAIIDDLPSRLSPDDPAQSFLHGFQSLVALPQYDGGEALNATVFLFPPGQAVDSSMIPMMHWQAGLFGRGTQNLVLRNQVSDALASLDRELQIVGAIQRSLLPRELPQIEGFELSAYYQTSARAGGDYYDFFPLAGGRWGIFIGDVSGHGTPAAVLMAITHAIAHAQPGSHTLPAALLAYLNNQLASAYTLDGSFVTAFYAVLDPRERTLNYSRAGHNPPRLVRGDKAKGDWLRAQQSSTSQYEGSREVPVPFCDGAKVVPLDSVGAFPLGIVDNQAFEQATVALRPGDLLLLYTDGITEALAPVEAPNAGAMFGTDRLDNLLLSCPAQSTDECLNQIRAAVAEFCHHAPPTDDQTLIAIRYI